MSNFQCTKIIFNALLALQTGIM